MDDVGRPSYDMYVSSKTDLCASLLRMRSKGLICGCFTRAAGRIRTSFCLSFTIVVVGVGRSCLIREVVVDRARLVGDIDQPCGASGDTVAFVWTVDLLTVCVCAGWERECVGWWVTITVKGIAVDEVVAAAGCTWGLILIEIACTVVGGSRSHRCGGCLV